MTHEKIPNAWLTKELAASRPHLLAVAYRMLSSRVEAEDAVQEAWLRVQEVVGAASCEWLGFGLPPNSSVWPTFDSTWMYWR